ncbi:MAG: chloramphenicol acetyltransferase [Lachnospiraceae bacterium]|nr:chloramphenicol acetyltransferase [Lachnospiraceae bacterium]
MAFRRLDLETYPRREHFEHFLTMDDPFFTVTVPVDLTEWQERRRQAGASFYLSLQYAMVRAANRVPELRQRISDGGIVEYDYCNPSFTVAAPDGTYRYCYVNVDQPFAEYLAEGRRKQEEAIRSEHLTEEGDVLGELFFSSTPWFSYTQVQTPRPDKEFSIPSFVIGRYAGQTALRMVNGQAQAYEKVTVPVSVMVHHALVDGLHVGQFYGYLEEELAGMFRG